MNLTSLSQHLTKTWLFEPKIWFNQPNFYWSNVQRELKKCHYFVFLSPSSSLPPIGLPE